MLIIVGVGYAQYSEIDKQKATGEVLRDGILYHMPENFITFFDDFFSFDSLGITNLHYGSWVWDTVGICNQPTIIDSSGGILKFINGVVDNDGFFIRYSAEIIKTVMNKDITHTWYVNISEDVQSSFFIGLNQSYGDTAANDTFSVYNGIGFIKPDGDSLIFGIISKDNNADTVSCDTLGENQWTKLTIKTRDTTEVSFYINDKYQGKLDSVGANYRIPVTDLSPYLQVLNGSTTAVTTMSDYVYIERKR